MKDMFRADFSKMKKCKWQGVSEFMRVLCVSAHSLRSWGRVSVGIRRSWDYFGIHDRALPLRMQATAPRLPEKAAAWHRLTRDIFTILSVNYFGDSSLFMAHRLHALGFLSEHVTSANPLVHRFKE